MIDGVGAYRAASLFSPVPDAVLLALAYTTFHTLQNGRTTHRPTRSLQDALTPPQGEEKLNRERGPK